MGRKTETFVADLARDDGKTFLLTEMPAAQAEKWATRAFMALASSGVEIPDNIRDMGLVGVASLGWKAFGGLPWDLAEPLLDEMMTCVKAMPDLNRPGVTRPLVDTDIEEIGTRIKMRMAIFKLHVDFSPAAASLTSDQATAQPASTV
jgi:hypothetical protein